MTLGLEFLDGLVDEVDERFVLVLISGRGSGGGPVVDLGAAVGELGDGEVADRCRLELLTETELGAEGVGCAGDAEGFPGSGYGGSAAEAVLEGDFGIVFGQDGGCGGGEKVGSEGSLAFHVSVSGEDEESDGAGFAERPSLEWAGSRGELADLLEIGVCVAFAVLELAEGSVVVVQSGILVDLDGVLRGVNVLGVGVFSGDGLLGGSDGVHVFAVVHSPDRFGAELADIEVEFGQVEVTSPAGEEVFEVLGVGGLEFAAEHVIFALVPHEAFDAVTNSLSVEIGEGGSDELEGEGVQLEPAG